MYIVSVLYVYIIFNNINQIHQALVEINGIWKNIPISWLSHVEKTFYVGLYEICTWSALSESQPS